MTDLTNSIATGLNANRKPEILLIDLATPSNMRSSKRHNILASCSHQTLLSVSPYKTVSANPATFSPLLMLAFRI